MWVGMPISGPGIPAGATITAVGASTITLSANATATTVGATIAICPFGVGDGSTTFNVPEMRGRVPRGWDNGANVDTGRVFGSYQADAYPSHNHSLPGAGSFFTTAAGGGSITLANWSAGSTGLSGSGSETRVKSTALLACVKY
jgi:microcystin-dependent protein